MLQPTPRDARAHDGSWPVLLWEPTSPRTRVGAARPPLGSTESRTVVLELRPRLRPADADVTVGSGAECDIVLAESTVSRLHARFRREPHTGLWSVTDLESERGTYQDGVLILPGRPAPLLCRSRLTLGNVELVFLQKYAFEQALSASSRASPVSLTRRR
ncbi:FHA domain-containing protein [Corallococcus macrosporus]|uniref:FHA domain-containing protein n=1 Tax=Myxococcus fulvus (strain ATCC BAA-855 / HW-1) TaxID=483219 RepID=F8CBL4_MYXFH|nr:FHA domain-containing protein [Corallococcus macrosporus]AEI64629.1 FHA domain-containing protein [Corallococcus macrosporus]